MSFNLLSKGPGVLKSIQRTVMARLASTATEATCVIYEEHGDPREVLKVVHQPLPQVAAGDVMIHMLASPVNPADINMVQGVYPVKPPMPAVGGNEGVGEVVAVGPGVGELEIGDWVVPSQSGWGTWRSHAVASSSNFLRIPKNIPVISAATMSVNACTAYRLLETFVPLAHDDVIIQNGANSAVGQAVIQIAHELKLQTVNIIRNRPNFEEVKHQLEEIGATHVVTDEMCRGPKMQELMKTVPKAKLALNCVGGKSVLDLIKHMAKGATMVTYGGMSKQPLMIPAGALIFNDIKVRGYWMTQWTMDNALNPDRYKMWQFLCGMVNRGKLTPSNFKLHAIENVKEAAVSAMEPYRNEKQILVMDEHLKQYGKFSAWL